MPLHEAAVEHLLGRVEQLCLDLLGVGYGAARHASTSGFTQVGGSSAVEQDARDVVGDQRRVVRLGVVGRAADVRGEHDVVASSRAGGRAARCSPTKWSRPAPPRWPRASACDERVGVVQRGARGVDVDRALASCGRTARRRSSRWSRASPPRASRRRRPRRAGRRASGWRRRAYGSYAMHPHAEALEAPLRRPADRAEPDDARGPARELPRPVALVGDRAAAVARRRARRGRRARCQRFTAKSSATVISATASALRPGRPQHRDARLRWRRRCRRCWGRPGTSRWPAAAGRSTGPFTESDSTMRRSAPSASTRAASCSAL